MSTLVELTFLQQLGCGGGSAGAGAGAGATMNGQVDMSLYTSDLQSTTPSHNILWSNPIYLMLYLIDHIKEGIVKNDIAIQ